MTTVVIEPTMTIREGGAFHVYSNKLRVGQNVEICRGFLGMTGKPIATGVVEANGSEDARAKVFHPNNGNAQAWKKYWKIRILSIK